MSNNVRAKKHLGQHFLKDEGIAKDIADALTLKGYDQILEIGPGMGVLTKYLLPKAATTHVIEIDRASVAYLQANYLQLSNRIIEKDFLKYDLKETFKALDTNGDGQLDRNELISGYTKILNS